MSIDLDLKSEYSHVGFFNIRSTNFEKIAINEYGKKLTGRVTKEHEPTIKQHVLESERWCIEPTAQSRQNMLLLDWDGKTTSHIPNKLLLLMSWFRSDGTRYSYHGIVKVVDANYDWLKKFVNQYSCNGLEMWIENKRMCLRGMYTGATKQTTKWKLKDDNSKPITYMTKKELGNLGIFIKNPTNQETETKRLLALRTVVQGDRYAYNRAYIGNTIRQANGKIPKEELYDKLILQLQTVMPTWSIFAQGGIRHAEVMRLIDDLLNTYDANKNHNNHNNNHNHNNTKNDRLNLYECASIIQHEKPLVTTALNNIIHGYEGNRWLEYTNKLKSRIRSRFTTNEITTYEQYEIIRIIEDNTRKHMEGEPDTDDIFNKYVHIFTFTNGQYDALTDEFTTECDSEILNTIRFDFPYRRDAQASKFLLAIDEWMKSEKGDTQQERDARKIRKIQWLKESYALAAIPKRIRQKGHIWYGAGSNAKGSAARILQKFLGHMYCTALTLKDMNGKDSHWAEDLIDKLLVVGGDGTGWKVSDTTHYKQLVGNDRISVNPKNKKRFTYDPICHVILLHNELPDPHDRSIGFVRKVQLVEFEQRFKEDASVEDAILNDAVEMAGIFNWIAPQIKHFLRGGPLVDPSTPDETRREWQMSGSDIDDFVKNRLLIIKGAKETTDNIYETYIAEYEYALNDNARTQKNVVIRQIKAALNENTNNIKVEIKDHTSNKIKVRYLMNVQINDDNDDNGNDDGNDDNKTNTQPDGLKDHI